MSVPLAPITSPSYFTYVTHADPTLPLAATNSSQQPRQWGLCLSLALLLALALASLVSHTSSPTGFFAPTSAPVRTLSFGPQPHALHNGPRALPSAVLANPHARPAGHRQVIGLRTTQNAERETENSQAVTVSPMPTVAAVSTEEQVAIIMNALRERFPDQPLSYFTYRFVASVTELVQRHGNPLDYYVTKLGEITQWRKDEDVNDILRQEFPRLDPGIMYWHGVDKLRQPVLFVRPGLVDMREFDEVKTYRTVIAVIEEGIAKMDDVVRFSVVIDTTGVGVRYFLPSFLKKLFYLMALPYRYRLGTVLVGPTNPIVNAVWQIAAPIIPPNFKKNVILSRRPKQALQQIMRPEDIPADIFTKVWPYFLVTIVPSPVFYYGSEQQHVPINVDVTS